MKKLILCVMSLISLNVFAGSCSVAVDSEIPVYTNWALTEKMDLDHRDFKTLRDNIALGLIERNYIPSYGNVDYVVSFKLNCFQLPFNPITNCESTVRVYKDGDPLEEKKVYQIDFANRFVALKRAIGKLKFCK